MALKIAVVVPLMWLKIFAYFEKKKTFIFSTQSHNRLKLKAKSEYT